MFPVLVDDHAADTRFTHHAADAPDIACNQRCQAFGGFVKNQHIGVGHECPANGEHLLLAATELLAAVAQAFFQSWEGVEHPVISPVALAARACSGCHFEVFSHAQVAKDTPTLGHVGNAHACRFVGRATRHGPACNVHRAAAWLDQAHDAFEQRAFAHAVTPHQANGFAAPDREVDTAQDVTGTVVGVEIFRVDH